MSSLTSAKNLKMLRRSVIALNNTFSVQQRNSSLSRSAVRLMTLSLQMPLNAATACIHYNVYYTFQGFASTVYLLRLVPDIYSFLFTLEGEKQSEHLCPIRLVAAESVDLLTLRLLQVFSFYTLLLLYRFSAGSFPLPERLNPLTKDRLKLCKYLL